MDAKYLHQKFINIYDRIAGENDYQRNDKSLQLIQICVVTVSAVATGFVNAFAHQERLGFWWAILLALLICGFVEKFYFTLRHGLNTVYQAGKQRFWALVCYRTIQLTMILNAAVLCVWIVGIQMPLALEQWFNWSIVVHFALALIGVAAVRDSDKVVANRMLELKSQTAKQDIITIRKTAAIGNPLVLFCARIRGVLDAIGLAALILKNKTDFAADSLKQIDALARTQDVVKENQVTAYQSVYQKGEALPNE